VVKLQHIDARKVRGLEIANTIGNRSVKAVSIKRLNKLAYKVRSQSNQDQWYNVINTYDDGWICECLDFQARHQNCKHIHAVHFSKLLRKFYLNPKIQILTVRDLLSDKRPDIPPTISVFQEAPLAKRTASHKQQKLI
jgi:hypothetical protein